MLGCGGEARERETRAGDECSWRREMGEENWLSMTQFARNSMDDVAFWSWGVDDQGAASGCLHALMVDSPLWSTSIPAIVPSSAQYPYRLVVRPANLRL